MCTDPIENDGNIFACRSCDECVATRRHGWVARAMAEKATNSHALVLALTYSDETEVGRQGARMFCYADVRDFMKRLRSAAAYAAKRERWNFQPEIRFLCAGEQGDRNGRCHWHMVIYSNFDLQRLGKFRLRGKLVSHRRDLMTVGKRKRRLNWDLWPHGFMTMQEPDQGGMSYVLSYCLKDQFTGEKSAKAMRYARSENFATGLFRMSKRPAIGERYLYQKLEEYLSKGACPPALQLNIPEFGGYWQPHGSFRKKLLWGLVALNQRLLWSTGAPAPQWSTLLASCRGVQSDMEILNVEEERQKREGDDIEADIRRRQSIDGGEQRRRETVRRCGSVLPCEDCLHELDQKTLARLGVVRSEIEGVWEYETVDGDSVRSLQSRPGSGVNPYCRAQGSKQIRLAFPATGSRAAS